MICVRHNTWCTPTKRVDAKMKVYKIVMNVRKKKLLALKLRFKRKANREQANDSLSRVRLSVNEAYFV